jgi:hypothetical protein
MHYRGKQFIVAGGIQPIPETDRFFPGDERQDWRGQDTPSLQWQAPEW